MTCLAFAPAEAGGGLASGSVDGTIALWRRVHEDTDATDPRPMFPLAGNPLSTHHHEIHDVRTRTVHLAPSGITVPRGCIVHAATRTRTESPARHRRPVTVVTKFKFTVAAGPSPPARASR